MEAPLIAFLAALQIILLALINGWFNHRAAKQAAKIKSEERAEEWRRQDIVAERVALAAEQAEKAAALLVSTQREAIVRTDEVARVAAESNKRITEKMDAIDEQGKKIHILVNSDMTSARTAERDSLKLLIISLKNAYALSKRLGVKRTEGLDYESVEIKRAEKRVEELNTILADRLAAQDVVDKRGGEDVVGGIEDKLMDLQETAHEIDVKVDGIAEEVKKERGHDVR